MFRQGLFAISSLPDLTRLVEDRVQGGECLPVEGVPPDVAPPAPDTDIGAPLSAGQLDAGQGVQGGLVGS